MKTNYEDARKRAGFTAQQAATKLGISISTLYSWEREKTSPDGPYIVKLSQLYGTTPNVLLGYSPIA